jgi:hypothetical protein
MDPVDCPVDTRPNPLADPQGVLTVVSQAIYQLWDVANTSATASAAAAVLQRHDIRIGAHQAEYPRLRRCPPIGV